MTKSKALTATSFPCSSPRGVLFLACLWGLLTFLGLRMPASAQVCTQPITLRTGTCPVGSTTCTTKGSALTWAELDNNLINIANLCNNPGGSGDSFVTINAPSGTDPVADSSTDTLNITCTGLTCTGTSGTDTLALVVSEVALGSGTSGGYAGSSTEGGAATSALAVTGFTASRCARFDGSGNLAAASGDCASGDTGGGGSTLAFGTIDTPSGTDPVADAAPDTLALTCGGGLACTGTAGTDTLDLTISTAPALAANGSNCSAGQWAAGVSASGVAEGCTADDDTPDSDSEVPDALTLSGGVIGANTFTGAVTSANLWNEGGQFSLGATPHFLGIAEGTSGSPITDPQPTVAFQRRASSGGSNSIPFQFTYQLDSGIGYHYALHSWVRNNSNTANDLVATTGSIYSDPSPIVTNLAGTPSTSGGTLATDTYSYYVSAIVGGVEIVASDHIDVSVTGPTGSVALTWTGVAGATDYRIYRYRVSAPDSLPVYQAKGSGTTGFTDAGAAGTGAVGLIHTNWALWARTEKIVDSTRLAGLELDIFNPSGRDAGPRVDRVGSTLGIQIVSGGTADNSVGVDITGESDARFHVGLLFREQAFRDYGLDFRQSDDTATAIRLANDQSIVSRNAADTLDTEVLKVGTADLLHLAGSAATVDGSNNRFGIVTTSPDERFEIETADNAETVALVENTNASGTSAIATVRSKADTAQVSMLAHGSGRTTNRFGVAVGGYAELLQTTGNGLLVGTSTAVPLILGTAATARLTIDANGNLAMGAAYVDIPQIAAPANPSAGTRRLYLDSSTGKLSVRTSAGTSVSLEEQGGGSITGGRSLTATGSTVDADIELYEQTKCMTIESPASGDDLLFYRVERAVTVTGIDCLVVGGTSVSTLVKECDSSGGTCGNTEAAITCGTTNTTEASTIDDPAWDAGDWIRVDPGTVTGAVTQMSVCVTYTSND